MNASDEKIGSWVDSSFIFVVDWGLSGVTCWGSARSLSAREQLDTSLSERSKLTYRRHGLEKGYGPGRRVNLHGEMRYGRDHSDGRLGSRQLVKTIVKKACGKAGQHNLPS